MQTPDYVQVTGVGNFANLGIPVGDTGGRWLVSPFADSTVIALVILG